MIFESVIRSDNEDGRMIQRRGRDSNPRGSRTPHPISSRRRYDRFGTSPEDALYVPKFITQALKAY